MKMTLSLALRALFNEVFVILCAVEQVIVNPIPGPSETINSVPLLSSTKGIVGMLALSNRLRSSINGGSCV